MATTRLLPKTYTLTDLYTITREEFNEMTKNGEFLFTYDVLGESFGFCELQSASVTNLRKRFSGSKRRPNKTNVFQLCKARGTKIRFSRLLIRDPPLIHIMTPWALGQMSVNRFFFGSSKE